MCSEKGCICTQLALLCEGPWSEKLYPCPPLTSFMLDTGQLDDLRRAEVSERVIGGEVKSKEATARS